jgi:hypothetical protein
MALPSLIIIGGLVVIPIGISAVGTYLAYKAYRCRDRITDKRPVENDYIELSVLKPDNPYTRNQEGLELDRASAPSSGIPLLIHKFDRTFPGASSSKVPQAAELDGASILKRESKSWTTIKSPRDDSPPEPHQRSRRPLAGELYHDSGASMTA